MLSARGGGEAIKNSRRTEAGKPFSFLSLWPLGRPLEKLKESFDKRKMKAAGFTHTHHTRAESNNFYPCIAERRDAGQPGQEAQPRVRLGGAAWLRGHHYIQVTMTIILS